VPQGAPVGLHVRDFGAHYEACLERTDAARRLVEQLGTATRGNHVAAMSALGSLAAFFGIDICPLIYRKAGSMVNLGRISLWRL